MKKNIFSFWRKIDWGILICALVLSAVKLPASSASASVVTDPGVIAYVTSVNGRQDQIRLLDPNGTNDRLLWSTGDMGVETNLGYVGGLTWKSGGSELAFHSSHQAACSFYGSDVYSVRQDGSNFRRIANPPACGQNPGLPTGTVVVTYYNESSFSGPFVLYFEGAPAPKAYAIPSGGSLKVTFNNVVDYGNKVQWAVAALGDYRYHSIEGNVDVIPGQTVQVSVYMTYGYADWSLHSPTWNYNGTELAYLFGNDANPFGIPANNTTPGALGTHLLGSVDDWTLPYSSHFLSYGPTQALSNQLIYSGYSDGDNIYLATVGQDEPGQILLKDSDLGGYGFKGLAWLPDGSGLLYSIGESFGDVANIFRYSFSTHQSYRLTDLSSGWARRMAVSPDGSQVVFELQTTGNSYDENPPTDLYIMNIDGSSRRLLATDGRSPAWGPTYIQPPVTMKMIYLPLLNHK